jgi:lysophospholipase L1-like esterase
MGLAPAGFALAGAFLSCLGYDMSHSARLVKLRAITGIRMKTIAALILPIILLLMIESCSRTMITLKEDLTPALADAINAHGVPSRELGWEGFRVPPKDIPDPKLPRIVTLGDSNTWGYGVSVEAAWPSVLRRALPNAEVVNMATLGYSSFQGVQTLRKYGDQLKPSLIVASFNFNDRAYVYDRRGDSEEKFTQFYDLQNTATRFNWLNKIYTTRILRAIMSRMGLVKSEPLNKIDARELDARVPPDRYRDNLRNIVEYGRERKIPVVFILLKDNPYYASQIRTGLAARDRGDYVHAIRAFTIGLTNAQTGPLARKYLAETYAMTGATDKAAEVGRMEPMRETVGGFNSIYLDNVYNNVMIEVGREQGVTVVDARPLLEPEMFIDMCHPDEIGQTRIAKLVLGAIKVVAPQLAEGSVAFDSTTGRRNELLVHRLVSMNAGGSSR